MKKLVRSITINDGDSKVLINGDRLFVETKPRADKIVQAFLNDGWELVCRDAIVNPAIQEEGVYSFYRGGFNYLFTKLVEDDVEDNSETLINEAVFDCSMIDDEEFYEEEFYDEEFDE